MFDGTSSFAKVTTMTQVQASDLRYCDLSQPAGVLTSAVRAVSVGIQMDMKGAGRI